MIYLIVPIYTFLIYSLQVIFKDKSKFLFLFIPALIFIFGLGMFRDISVGTDTYMYYQSFRFSLQLEPGFRLINSIVKSLGGNFSFFLAFFFFLSLYLKILSFKKISNNFLISFLIYSGFWFLVYDMNGIRQGMALGFVGLSLAYLSEKKIRMFYLMLLFAVMNHYTAIVFLPFVLLIERINCSKKLYFYIFFITVIFAVSQVAKPLIEFISNLIGAESYLGSKANDYQSNEEFNKNILYSFSTVIRIVVFFITYFVLQKVQINDRLKNILLWSALLNIVIYLLFSQFEVIATRMSLYYRFGECIVFSFLPEITNNKFLKILIGLCLLGYVIMQITQTLSMKNNNLIPYESILFK